MIYVAPNNQPERQYYLITIYEQRIMHGHSTFPVVWNNG